jgi:hypothetical protein
VAALERSFEVLAEVVCAGVHATESKALFALRG